MTRATLNTLFSWPAPHGGIADQNRICVAGAPTDLGNGIARGTALAPSAIRKASLACTPPPVSGVDCGDVAGGGLSDLSSFLDRLAQTVTVILERGMFPFILGGDHSITFAPVSILARSRELCLIWFDAHTDFSPWSGRGSHDHKQVLRRIYALEGVQRIVQVGHRGITSGDERRLGAKAVVVTSAVARSLRASDLLALIPGELPCYISVDIDVVDPLFAPGTAAPVPDGLSPDTISALLTTIIRNRQVAGVDLVEVNPRMDARRGTISTAARLARGVVEDWGPRLAAARSSAFGRPWPAQPSRSQE